ncbi:MAG: bacteriohemerythrin [Polyangiaceae bacterium]
MSAITWGPSLEVGIETIDKQHRRWVELFNALDAAVKEGKEESALGEALEAYIEYSQYHFKTEEALMRQANMDEEEYKFHLREHKVFRDQMTIFRDRHSVGFLKMSPQVVEYLQHWLLAHVTMTDRGYIQPIKDAGIA